MKNVRWLFCLNLVALIAVSIWFRCRDLGNLPGINGDEAWYGVQAELVLHGESITWRTPTGNLLNPLFFGPQLLLHALFEPSIAVLRTTAVLSGLTALAINYCLCRKVFGGRAAAVSTAILAVLPINIVYSRLAWDSSQSLLVALPAIYWPLRAIVVPQWRTWFSAGGLIALAAAIVVHPTNLFIGPFVGVCLLVAWREEILRVWRRAAGKAGAIAAAMGLLIVTGIVGWSRLPAVASRVTDVADYAAFAVNVGRLFSGATVYQYVAGSIAPATENEQFSGILPFDLAAGLAALFLGWGIYRQLADWRRSQEDETEESGSSDRIRSNVACARAALFVGSSLSLLAFFLIAGPPAIAPHFERYGICLIGPGAILAALAIEWWIDRRHWTGRAAAAIAVLCGWGLLAGFQAHFSDFIERTGGESHLTFRTAVLEPKVAALDFIRQHSSRARVLASEWWIYWPLKYLSFDRPSFGSPRVDVRIGRSQDGARPGIVVEPYSDLRRSVGDLPDQGEPLWIVEFTGSPTCEGVRQWSRDRQRSISESTIDDFAGRPLLSLFSVEALPVTSLPAKKP
jgi:Dolichyl-phosphate-mannose-protein mannosyltransferase